MRNLYGSIGLAAATIIAASGLNVATTGIRPDSVVRASHERGIGNESTAPNRTGTPEQRAAWLRVRTTSKRWNSYPKAGWSVRQGQRMALKRRNQRRSK